LTKNQILYKIKKIMKMNKIKFQKSGRHLKAKEGSFAFFVSLLRRCGMKSKVFSSLLVVCFILLSGFVFFGYAQEDTVTIGLNVPLTGSYSDQGADELKAYKLAIDEVNAAGGLLGKRVVYVEKDSETNAQIAGKNTAELYDNFNAIMVTGGSASSEAVASSKVAKEKGKVFMACLTHSDATTGFDIDPKTGEQFS
jgi:ABC-type branched-subunit amino acid transport system substrate-binding protein